MTNIHCNICEIFQSSKGDNNKNLPHLVCKAKYAKFAVLESCVHLRNKTTTQRYQLIKQHQICAKCLLTNQHSTASCRYFSSKKYLKCSNAFCDLRYSLCSSHIEENKKKFQELNGISENFGIHVKTYTSTSINDPIPAITAMFNSRNSPTRDCINVLALLSPTPVVISMFWSSVTSASVLQTQKQIQPQVDLYCSH